jgi:hypothetical protein
MSRAQAEVHDVLERQYGLRAAGNFMPHAEVFNRGIVPFGRDGIAIDSTAPPKERPTFPYRTSTGQ